MTTADDLLRWLQAGPACDGVTVTGWRCEVAEGTGLRVGIRASEVGGPYEGPAGAVRLAGTLDLHWSDGSITRANLDRGAVIAPDAQLAAWRAAAVHERTGSLPPLAGPAALPAVETFDPAVDRAVTADPGHMLGLLGRVRTTSLAGDIRRLDATLRASSGRRLVATSRGFRADWPETACSLELWADEAAGAGYARRALPTDADLARMTGETGLLAPQLRAPTLLPPDARGVLFLPNVVEDLVARLLLPNLAGRAIRDGRSPFTRADLDDGTLVMRPDLHLVVDTTLPLELATAPCSPDGVPAGRVALIAAGRLASPLLDQTTALAFGLPPTPVARGRPLALLVGRMVGHAPPLEYLDGAAAVGLLKTGVIVRDLPGLHTQSPRRGSYALVAPDAQAVVRGAPGGRCAVQLQGSLLDHLSRPSTRLVAVPGVRSPGLLVLDGVSLRPA